MDDENFNQLGIVIPAAAKAKRGFSRYSVNQCVFYKLANRRKLATLFNMKLPEFRRLIFRADNYRTFYIVASDNKKKRLVEWPKPTLERLHRRLLRLISHVEVPKYLHSGVRGRSYISNARVHVGNFEVRKLDIKSFYPSTTSRSIHDYFMNVMRCSPDVSQLLTALVTYRGHLPTGSAASQLVAFFAHQRMFDALFAISSAHNITMSVYVDDITFSGSHVPNKFMYEVKKIIHNHGLAYHKEKSYLRSDRKLITGVIVSSEGIYVRNRLHKSIYDGFEALENTDDTAEQIEIVASLAGRINAASQIEPGQRKKLFRIQRKSASGN